MAITANPAVESSAAATSLDSFLQKNTNSIGSWADQCDDESYSNSMNSEDTCDSSFGLEQNEGWNKVKSKSERLESRNSKPNTEERFRSYSKYRNKTSQYFATHYTQQRKYNQDSFPNRHEYSPKPNQCISDLHSNSESGEAEKQLDINEKEKLEFVDAPVPKVNPWSKSDRVSKEQSSVKYSPIPLSTSSAKKSYLKSSPKLPSSCGWGKSFNKGKGYCVRIAEIILK